MLRDHARRFPVWVQCGQCLLFCCLSACTIDRAGLHAALQRTDSSAAAEMSDASVEGPHADACHDASLVRGDASEWPVRDAEEPMSDAGGLAFDGGRPSADAGHPSVDAGHPSADAGADASLPDLCPNDPAKTEDVDTDDDGILDCNDECPLDPDKTAKGICGCGNAEPDDSKRPPKRRGAACPAR